MNTSASWLVCLSLFFSPSLSCYECFIEPEDSLRLCFGYYNIEYKIQSVDMCFATLKRMFDNNEEVLEAGKVGEGYDEDLRDILNKEILAIADDFNKQQIVDTLYEVRLKRAATKFIAAASNLPRETRCVPPCGFQNVYALYNCTTCRYDSCGFPLDCSVEEIKAVEYSRSTMLCTVAFELPDNIEVAWRFAEEVKTQQVDQFKEVTSGVDTVYSIPSTGLHHQGTYQCEIYSSQRSIVRLYYYLTVTPQDEKRHTELQEIFDLSQLPGGQLLPEPGGPPYSPPVSPSVQLLTACLIALLLLLFLSLGALYLSTMSEQHTDGDED